MIYVALCVYYNNNSLSSPYPVWMESVPHIGDTIWYKVDASSQDTGWKVVDVIHQPVRWQPPEEKPSDESPSVRVECRPEWAFDPDDYRNQRD